MQTGKQGAAVWVVDPNVRTLRRSRGQRGGHLTPKLAYAYHGAIRQIRIAVGIVSF